MAYINQIEYEAASEEVKEKFREQIGRYGRITNMKKTLLNSLPAFNALMQWYDLEKEVKEVIGDRASHFYCYAISTQNECIICSMFFTKILEDLHIDFDSFNFTDEEADLIEYGRILVKDPANVPSVLMERLKERYSQEEVVLITAFGSMMIATNLINTALQIELDDVLVSYVNQ